MCEPSDMTFTARQSTTAKVRAIAIDDDRETRAEVCEECPHSVSVLPLTCGLLVRQKQAGLLPCPHLLRALLDDPAGRCPSPDEAWSARWSAAAIAAGVANYTAAVAPTAKAATTATRPDRELPRWRRRGHNERIIYIHPARALAGA